MPLEPIMMVLVLIYLIQQRVKTQALINGMTRYEEKQQQIEAAKPTEFSCFMWETRHLQRRLVDEGVITEADMNVCDDLNCLNCKPTRQAIAEREIEEHNAKQRELEYKSAVKRQRDYQHALRHARDDHKSNYYISLEQPRQRTIRPREPRCTEEGYVLNRNEILPRPSGVPQEAIPEIIDEPAGGKKIVWEWRDSQDRRVVWHKSLSDAICVSNGCGCEQTVAAGMIVLRSYCGMHNRLDRLAPAGVVW